MHFMVKRFYHENTKTRKHEIYISFSTFRIPPSEFKAHLVSLKTADTYTSAIAPAPLFQGLRRIRPEIRIDWIGVTFPGR